MKPISEMRRVCEYCRFYFVESSECRRYPPTTQWVNSSFMNKDGFAEDDSYRCNSWPNVEKDEFCGEYKLLEELPE